VSPRFAVPLRLAQWTSLAVVALIVGYGIRWAAWMHRLPWQEDGSYRFWQALGLL